MDLREKHIQAFVIAHENDDITKLALGPMPADWPRKAILDQIKSRQKAKIKLPAWLNVQGLIFPSPSLLEQCSSDATAHFKASLFSGETFADLTAGAGADTAAFAQNFKRGFAIERDHETSETLANNLPLLSHTQIDVINKSAEDALDDLPPLDLVYIDPQRRNESTRGLFKLEDTSPNVLALLPKLKEKARNILIKTSPVLDITQAISQLGHVAHIYVVSLGNECKELLFHITDTQEKPAIHAIILGHTPYKLTAKVVPPANITQPQTYLYEPDAGIMKAGLFNELAAEFNIAKLHPHTHLFTADHKLEKFPGRSFVIQNIIPADKRELQKNNIEKANLTLRNFPGTVDELRKKLNLKDGGDDYIFACTLGDEQKVLICCRRC
ncbi:MAG: SAM-dependent methyltransferase [Alphaproteobacteria bacterium]|nr:SAM-dependent methyltransferase [Alphaproteobacteria bacterium]